MAFAGLRGTGDWGTDERPKNFREAILWANPNGQAPLTALLSKMKTETTDDPEFAWWEEKLTPIRITTSADLSAASTTVTTASGALNLVAGDILLLEKPTQSATYDDELVVVSSVTNDTTFIIKRGQFGTSAAGFASGNNMSKLGTVFEEGTGRPNVSLRNPTKLKNYTQIFKTSMEQTNTAQATRARTGNAWDNDKKRKMFDHSIALEMQFLFGRSSETATGATLGKPIRTTGGLREFITTNKKVYSTTPTESDFLDFCTPLFDYSSNTAGDERILLCGNGFWNGLNKLAKNSSSTRVNFTGQIINVYGMRLEQWKIPVGTFAVKTHPLMNVHARFNYSAFIISPPSLTYRPLRGRDTKFLDNQQDNDEDLRAAQWRTEVGLEVHHEFNMGYIGNFIVP